MTDQNCLVHPVALGSYTFISSLLIRGNSQYPYFEGIFNRSFDVHRISLSSISDMCFHISSILLPLYSPSGRLQTHDLVYLVLLLKLFRLPDILAARRTKTSDPSVNDYCLHERLYLLSNGNPRVL